MSTSTTISSTRDSEELLNILMAIDVDEVIVPLAATEY